MFGFAHLFVCTHTYTYCTSVCPSIHLTHSLLPFSLASNRYFSDIVKQEQFLRVYDICAHCSSFYFGISFHVCTITPPNICTSRGVTVLPYSFFAIMTAMIVGCQLAWWLCTLCRLKKECIELLCRSLWNDHLVVRAAGICFFSLAFACYD